MSRFKTGSAGILVFLLAVCALAPGASAAGLLIADGGFGGVLEIEQHDAQVTINNGIAVTEVTQVFRNTESRVVEALYTFPVPRGASVSNFSMWIDGQEMVGEVVEKQRAREIYESYKQTRRDPGLLEQVDYKTFEMRIFPIPAGAEQRVQVTYCQELSVDHDQASYVYPLATVSRAGLDEQTKSRFSLNVDLKSEVPITGLTSPSHESELVVATFDECYRRASLEMQAGDLSRDVVLNFDMSRPQTGFDIITSAQAGEDGYFQLTLTAGQELGDADRGMDYVFLLDISGSMANSSKLSLSRRSVQAFVEQLGEDDRFEVMTFNVTPTPLFGKLRDCTEPQRLEARTFLESRRARGGTVLRPALTHAYKYRDADRPLNVVVLSDGMTEQREQRELVELIGQRPDNCRVFCIGIGNEVNRPLLSQLAEEAGGLAAFVSQEDDFQRQAAGFRRKLVHPVATNLNFKLDGVEAYDVEPRTLPNLFHGSPLKIYGRYRRSGESQITIAGEIMGAPFRQTVAVGLPEVDDQNPEIERMWASHRVEHLKREQRAAGTEIHKDAIVELCEQYSIVSEYASFIVLENDAEYRRWKISRRNASRLNRDRRAQENVKRQLQQLRNESLAKLTPPTDAQPQLTSLPTATGPGNSSRTPGTQGRNFNISPGGGGGGGGALDPFSAAIALSLAGGGALAARRRRREGVRKSQS